MAWVALRVALALWVSVFVSLLILLFSDRPESSKVTLGVIQALLTLVLNKVYGHLFPTKSSPKKTK